MVKWTDDESSDATDALSRPSAPARVGACFGRWLPTSDALFRIARCTVAGGLTLALLAFVAVRAGVPEQEAVAAVIVQAPIFAKLRQSVTTEPSPTSDQDLAVALEALPPTADLASRWLRPALEFGQVFAEAPGRMKRLCEDFAATGFARAHWQASAVFDGEWECSSALAETGRDGDAAFLVVRGASERSAGSLMLKLNPLSVADRATLIGRVEPVIAEFLRAAHVAPSADVLDRIATGEPANFSTSFGVVRIVAEYNRPEVRVINLSVSPALDAPPPEPCSAPCLARFQPPKVTIPATTQVAAR